MCVVNSRILALITESQIPGVLYIICTTINFRRITGIPVKPMSPLSPLGPLQKN